MRLALAMTMTIIWQLPKFTRAVPASLAAIVVVAMAGVGPLFFASVASFKALVDPRDGPADVAIDFYSGRVYDPSAIEANDAATEKDAAAGKRLHLRHLGAECRALLARAASLVEVNVAADPHYHVAGDRPVG